MKFKLSYTCRRRVEFHDTKKRTRNASLGQSESMHEGNKSSADVPNISETAALLEGQRARRGENKTEYLSMAPLKSPPCGLLGSEHTLGECCGALKGAWKVFKAFEIVLRAI